MPTQKVAFVTDSTAYLPADLLDRYQIHTVPLKVHWGADTFRDGVDIQPAEFCARLRTDKVMPTTAAPSIGEFQTKYAEVLKTAEAIISIHISSLLSATASSAEQAKAFFPGQRIEVIDSHLTTMGLGFVILAMARAVEAGATVDEAVTLAQDIIPTVRILLVVDTLEYLRRGGRIGAAQAFLGNMMDIKPLLEVREGRIQPLERARTKKKALERLVGVVAGYAQAFPAVRLAAAHADAPDEAAALLELATRQIKTIETMIVPVSPVIATHTGPGLVGLVCCPA